MNRKLMSSLVVVALVQCASVAVGQGKVLLSDYPKPMLKNAFADRSGANNVLNWGTLVIDIDAHPVETLRFTRHDHGRTITSVNGKKIYGGSIPSPSPVLQVSCNQTTIDVEIDDQLVTRPITILVNREFESNIGHHNRILGTVFSKATNAAIKFAASELNLVGGDVFYFGDGAAIAYESIEDDPAVEDAEGEPLATAQQQRWATATWNHIEGCNIYLVGQTTSNTRVAVRAHGSAQVHMDNCEVFALSGFKAWLQVSGHRYFNTGSSTGWIPRNIKITNCKAMDNTVGTPDHIVYHYERYCDDPENPDCARNLGTDQHLEGLQVIGNTAECNAEALLSEVGTVKALVWRGNAIEFGDPLAGTIPHISVNQIRRSKIDLEGIDIERGPAARLVQSAGNFEDCMVRAPAPDPGETKWNVEYGCAGLATGSYEFDVDINQALPCP